MEFPRLYQHNYQAISQIPRPPVLLFISSFQIYFNFQRQAWVWYPFGLYTHKLFVEVKCTLTLWLVMMLIPGLGALKINYGKWQLNFPFRHCLALNSHPNCPHSRLNLQPESSQYSHKKLLRQLHSHSLLIQIPAVLNNCANVVEQLNSLFLTL